MLAGQNAGGLGSDVSRNLWWHRSVLLLSAHCQFALTQHPQAKWLGVGKTAKSGVVETIWPGCKPFPGLFPGFSELQSLHPGCGLISYSYLMFDMRANAPVHGRTPGSYEELVASYRVSAR